MTLNLSEVSMAERLVWHHGKYRLVPDGRIGDAVVVRAYLGARLLHKGYAPALDEAVAETRWWLDQYDRGLRARRRNGRPSAEEYRRALTLLPLGADHEAMLRAHAGARDRTITVAQLAAAIGRDDATASRCYGRLGRMIAEFIGFTPPDPRQRGQPLWTAAIATPRRRDDGTWSWVMFPEVAEALAALDPIWNGAAAPPR